MMEQCILEPIKINIILNLLFTDEHELVTSSTVSDKIMLDHRVKIVGTNLSCGASSDIRVSARNNDMSSLNFFNKHVDWVAINFMLFSIDWHNELERISVHDINKKTCQKLWDICSGKVPLRRSPQSKGIIPKDRKVLIRKRTRLYK